MAACRALLFAGLDAMRKNIVAATLEMGVIPNGMVSQKWLEPKWENHFAKSRPKQRNPPTTARRVWCETSAALLSLLC